MNGIKCIDCGQQVTTIYLQRKRCGSVKEKSGCSYRAFLIAVRKKSAEYRKNRKFRKKESAYYKQWYEQSGRKRNRIHQRAQNMVAYAIKQGILVRPENCQCCNKKAKIQAHHQDYSKPLQVLWLCQPCHKLEHQVSL